MSTKFSNGRALIFRMVLVLAVCLPLAVSFQPAAAAAPALAKSGCAIVVNSNSAGGLAVRNNATTSAGIIRRIPDGTIVTITDGPRSANNYTWWYTDQGGWSAGSYLQDTACVNSAVRNARAILARNSWMYSPWHWVDAPLTNSVGKRSAATYQNVIEQFDVANQTYAGRYVDRTGRCNIFAGDVMRAMGAALPTKGQLGTGTTGSKWTDPMQANASDIYNWLKASNGGWKRIDVSTRTGLNTLISYVNAGKPAVASRPDHIAVIRPGQSNPGSWKDLFSAQAGASNYLVGRLGSGFATGAAPDIFVHD